VPSDNDDNECGYHLLDRCLSPVMYRLATDDATVGPGDELDPGGDVSGQPRASRVIGAGQRIWDGHGKGPEP
jgi:hypothetical protein